MLKLDVTGLNGIVLIKPPQNINAIVSCQKMTLQALIIMSNAHDNCPIFVEFNKKSIVLNYTRSKVKHNRL